MQKEIERDEELKWEEARISAIVEKYIDKNDQFKVNFWKGVCFIVKHKDIQKWILQKKIKPLLYKMTNNLLDGLDREFFLDSVITDDNYTSYTVQQLNEIYAKNIMEEMK